MSDSVIDPASEALTDDAKLGAYARALADAVGEHFPAWVRGVFELRFDDDQLEIEAESIDELAGPMARSLAAEVRALLDLDIDEQRGNPLAVLRRPAGAIASVLQRRGVAPPERDAEARRLHPGDLYDLGPAAFGDIHADVHDAGIAWGAAKAHVHLRRRRDEGLR